MRNKHVPTIIAVAVAVAAAGCAAAVPGYSPPRNASESTKPQHALTKPFDPGSLTASGTYQPSDAEQKLDCGKLTGSMHIIMRRLDDAPNRPRQSAASKSIQDLAAPAHQGKTPIAISDEIVREKARLKAYNELLAVRRCKILDIAAYR